MNHRKETRKIGLGYRQEHGPLPSPGACCRTVLDSIIFFGSFSVSSCQDLCFKDRILSNVDCNKCVILMTL
jgi:hypothetical protein